MDKQLQQLEDVLAKQVSLHEKLLQLLKQKRQYLRHADQENLARCYGLENNLVQELSELEKKRLHLVASLTLLIDSESKQPMRLNELADRLEEPQRGRLLVLRQQLLSRMKQARQETAVSKRAIESLVRHMQGLFLTLGSVMTGGGLYSNQGAIPKDTLAVSTINTTA